jgi:hypothetical protein
MTYTPKHRKPLESKEIKRTFEPDVEGRIAADLSFSEELAMLNKSLLVEISGPHLPELDDAPGS